MNLKDSYFYIEFEIINSARFKALQKMFHRLMRIKNDWMQDINLEDKKSDLDYQDPVADFDWYSYLDNEAIAYFQDIFDYRSDEGKVYRQLWDLTHYEYRLHPFLRTPGNWDFESMLDSIFSGDYILFALVKENNNLGCLYYDPRGFPFGGSDSLCELVRAFGHKVTYDSWHEDENPKIKSQWNYELAKELVEQGIGFTPEILTNL